MYVYFQHEDICAAFFGAGAVTGFKLGFRDKIRSKLWLKLLKGWGWAYNLPFCGFVPFLTWQPNNDDCANPRTRSV